MHQWRDAAAPVVAAVLREYPERGPEQRRALRVAYPFGERRRGPYRAWLREVARQRENQPIPGQISMFDDGGEEALLHAV